MYYTSDPGLLFVHIPKNAGKSIHAALLERYEGPSIKFRKKHTSLNTAREYMSEDEWRRAFKFAIVRNPWDRVVSQWAYTQMIVCKQRGNRLIRANIPMNDDETFMETKAKRRAFAAEILENSFMWWLMAFNQKPKVRWFHYRLKNEKHNLINIPQSMWLTTNGKLVTDKIYRFENLGELERDLDLKLECLNASPREGHYRDYYNTKTREWVAKVYAEDIDRFGYTF